MGNLIREIIEILDSSAFKKMAEEAGGEKFAALLRLQALALQVRLDAGQGGEKAQSRIASASVRMPALRDAPKLDGILAAAAELKKIIEKDGVLKSASRCSPAVNAAAQIIDDIASLSAGNPSLEDTSRMLGIQLRLLSGMRVPRQYAAARKAVLKAYLADIRLISAGKPARFRRAVAPLAGFSLSRETVASLLPVFSLPPEQGKAGVRRNAVRLMASDSMIYFWALFPLMQAALLLIHILAFTSSVEKNPWLIIANVLGFEGMRRLMIGICIRASDRLLREEKAKALAGLAALQKESVDEVFEGMPLDRLPVYKFGWSSWRVNMGQDSCLPSHDSKFRRGLRKMGREAKIFAVKKHGSEDDSSRYLLKFQKHQFSYFLLYAQEGEMLTIEMLVYTSFAKKYYSRLPWQTLQMRNRFLTLLFGKRHPRASARAINCKDSLLMGLLDKMIKDENKEPRSTLEIAGSCTPKPSEGRLQGGNEWVCEPIHQENGS